MADRTPTPPPRLPFSLAAGALLVGALVVAIVFIDRANSVSTPSTTASPSSSAATASCTTATFSTTPLPPLNEPTNPHVYSAPPPMQIDTTKLYEATITTTHGAILVCLQPSLAPNTVNNFVALARNHFYDGIPFHRVCPNTADSSCGGTLAIIQGGDPNCIGNVGAATCGQGGPGYKFNDETVHGQYVAGSVAMANSGANTNGSQFFIDTAANQFAPSYNLFGTVISGLAVAKSVVRGDVMQTVTVAEQQ